MKVARSWTKWIQIERKWILTPQPSQGQATPGFLCGAAALSAATPHSSFCYLRLILQIVLGLSCFSPT